MAKNIRVLTRTLAGTAAEAMGTRTVPSHAQIFASAANVFMGASDVSSTNGVLLPTGTASPLQLGPFSDGDGDEWVDLNTLFVRGAATNVVTIFWFED
jgi:hypothetical protein